MALAVFLMSLFLGLTTRPFCDLNLLASLSALKTGFFVASPLRNNDLTGKQASTSAYLRLQPRQFSKECSHFLMSESFSHSQLENVSKYFFFSSSFLKFHLLKYSFSLDSFFVNFENSGLKFSCTIVKLLL